MPSVRQGLNLVFANLRQMLLRKLKDEGVRCSIPLPEQNYLLGNNGQLSGLKGIYIANSSTGTRFSSLQKWITELGISVPS